MHTLIINHRVRDFAGWKPVFDEHEDIRRRHGAEGHDLFVSPEDKSSVAVHIDFPSAGAGDEFLADPTLREAMEKAGVEGPPDTTIREKVEEVIY